jgi:two-component system invasion response regulator UvrY
MNVTPIKVVFLDSNRCFLDLLKNRFKTEPGIHCVAFTHSIQQTVPYISDPSIQLIISDTELEDGGIVKLSHEAMKVNPEIHIAAYATNFPQGILVQGSVGIIDGFISKSESIESLIYSMQRIAIGEKYISPYIQQHIRLDHNHNKMIMSGQSLLSELSPRQIDVLVHLANGLSVKEVAKELHLSPKSVDSHKYRLMTKLNIKDRVDLARFAIRNGLIEA